ncbi:hypothetical protein SprV_0100402400 [Sparganum proliferum]
MLVNMSTVKERKMRNSFISSTKTPRNNHGVYNLLQVLSLSLRKDKFDGCCLAKNDGVSRRKPYLCNNLWSAKLFEVSLVPKVSGVQSGQELLARQMFESSNSICSMPLDTLMNLFLLPLSSSAL